MHAMKVSPNQGESQEARWATEDSPGLAAPNFHSGNDSEMGPLIRHRQYTNAYTRGILQVADRCKPGEINQYANAPRGRLLILPMHLATPLRGGRSGDSGPVKRTTKADPHWAKSLHIVQLTRQRDGSNSRLDKTLLIIDFHKTGLPCRVIRPTTLSSCDRSRKHAHPCAGRRRSMPCGGCAARSDRAQQGDVPPIAECTGGGDLLRGRR